jgi:hypothetical protein
MTYNKRMLPVHECLSWTAHLGLWLTEFEGMLSP